MKALIAMTLAAALLFTATHADAKKHRRGHGKKPAAAAPTKDSGKAEPKK